MEDKQLILDLLTAALQQTAFFAADLDGLYYDENLEIVTAKFRNGFEKNVNIAADSGIAMIRDVLAHIV